MLVDLLKTHLVTIHLKKIKKLIMDSKVLSFMAVANH